MNAATIRRRIRFLHIALSGIIGTYLYSPWSGNPALNAITLYVAFPLMALSGIAMWQQGRWARLFRDKR